MKCKLHISKVRIQNFRSIKGLLEVNLDNLGPVLVSGENGAGKSSIFVESIIWCLFGRTTKRPKPGDKHVVNWEVGKDCYVEVVTADNWFIKRTRKMDGHNDLLIMHGKDEKTQSTNQEAQLFLLRQFNLDYNIFIASVCFGQKCKSFLEAGSVKQRKAALDKILFLDKLNIYADIAKQRMADCSQHVEVLNERLKGYERDIIRLEGQIQDNSEYLVAFNVKLEEQRDRCENELMILRAEYTDFKLVDIDKIQEKWNLIDKVRKKIDGIKNSISKASNEIKRLNCNIENNADTITRSKERIDKIIDVDLSKIIKQYEEYKKQNSDKEEILSKISKITQEIKTLEAKVKSDELYLKGFSNKSGGICPECKQFVDEKHINSHSRSFVDIIDDNKTILVGLADNKSRLEAESTSLSGHINEPLMTIAEAQWILRERTILQDEIARAQKDIKNDRSRIDLNQKEYDHHLQQSLHAEQILFDSRPSISLAEALKNRQRYDELIRRTAELELILKETRAGNPYQTIDDKLRHDLSLATQPLLESKIEIEKSLLEQHHYLYMRKAFSDRNKIKRFLLGKMIPLFNSRIKFYEDMFDSSCGLRFTDTLGMETNHWDYEEHSGGEQKRVDVVLMFALHDLITAIYGKQCNIMIMDEIDASLDVSGVRHFVELIERFCSSIDSPDSVFIISHKEELKHNFPSELVIENVGGCTTIN